MSDEIRCVKCKKEVDGVSPFFCSECDEKLFQMYYARNPTEKEVEAK